MKPDTKASAETHEAQLKAFLWFFGALAVATGAALLIAVWHATDAYAAAAGVPAPTASEIKTAIDKWETLRAAFDDFWKTWQPIANWVLGPSGLAAWLAALLPKWQGGALGLLRDALDKAGANVLNAKNAE
jgi:hypothetical protein